MNPLLRIASCDSFRKDFVQLEPNLSHINSIFSGILNVRLRTRFFPKTHPVLRKFLTALEITHCDGASCLFFASYVLIYACLALTQDLFKAKYLTITN